MADSPKTHRGEISPLSDAGGTHFASVLPSTSARKRHRGEKAATDRRPGTHRGIISPRLDPPRKRTTAKYCHGRQPGDAFRRNIATTCPLGTHGVDTLPRQGTPGICGRDMLPLPVRAALARCRDEGAGGARGNHRPLRREWGICVALAHGACAAVFSGSGGTAQPARCRVRLSALIAGARVPFQRLNCEEWL